MKSALPAARAGLDCRLLDWCNGAGDCAWGGMGAPGRVADAPAPFRAAAVELVEVVHTVQDGPRAYAARHGLRV
ncbi:MAG: hypothetical protein IT168_23135 [Bryobacterales bacterium]|nr:hypothetical protein [Bryobacterales bacterium]